jgi:23S rRNA pseudouridine1911/1915/1917 synthase
VNSYGKSLSSIGGEERPGIVHRLDKDTSGLMIIAKNDDAHIKLSDDIAQRKVKRIYTALVWGNINPDSGKVETHIGRSSKDRTRMCVVDYPNGKHAVTHYETIQSFGYISMVECRLETGRTHQIRIHMSHISHSVVGDQAYGNNARKINLYYSGTQKEALQTFKRQALHSSKLEFTHPRTNELMYFESELPEDMQNLISIL